MQQTRAIVAIVLIASGLVWIGQGTGLLRGGSFMVNDERWALIGLGCVVAGIVIASREVRRRRAKAD